MWFEPFRFPISDRRFGRVSLEAYLDSRHSYQIRKEKENLCHYGESSLA